MAKMFGGKETPAEEMAEAKALKSGKISKGQYVKGEKMEGHGKGAKSKADAIKSGKMSPKQYAEMHKKEGMKKMANGGMAQSFGGRPGAMTGGGKPGAAPMTGGGKPGAVPMAGGGRPVAAQTIGGGRPGGMTGGGRPGAIAGGFPKPGMMLADGGMAGCASGMSGTGRRSMQDYGK